MAKKDKRVRPVVEVEDTASKAAAFTVWQQRELHSNSVGTKAAAFVPTLFECSSVLTPEVPLKLPLPRFELALTVLFSLQLKTGSDNFWVSRIVPRSTSHTP